MSDRLSATCPSCGAEAKFQISAPRIALDGTDPAFPGAWDKWEKKREQKLKEERSKSYYEPDS
jgi:predicted nucleic acid-binding Zn ribbon protein